MSILQWRENFRPRRRGFTLIEILATLGILSVGLASVIALVLGSTRMSVGAVDKNTATMIISEAVEDIARIHLITNDQLTASGLATRTGDVGYYIETLDSSPGANNPATGMEWPNVQSGDFAAPTAVVVANSSYLSEYRNPLPSPALSNMIVWPPTPTPRYYGGPLRAGGNATGTAFRAMYRLERHPDWIASLPPNPVVPSPYEGIYVLTMAVYKDLQPKEPVSNPNHTYEQISDPVVTFLRTKN